MRTRAVVFSNENITFDSWDTVPSGDLSPKSPVTAKSINAFIDGKDTCLLSDFGFAHGTEEILINGVVQTSIVGRLIAQSKNKTFNTHDREILSGFAAFIRQRIVDFNKEWRSLSHNFSHQHIAELLTHENYAAHYLAPKEAKVAILYADIAGFTKISEQILKKPEAVGAWIEAWSKEVIDCVWKHGGVFDKMVGDCVIALFGPPFYSQSEEDKVASALHCALEIRDITQKKAGLSHIVQLREIDTGVAIGVNYAPLFVGRFGTNEDFTGFSSGMNNAARLQGCAIKNEILVMDQAIDALKIDSIATKSKFKFGPESQMAVKNVQKPLKYKNLIEGEINV